MISAPTFPERVDNLASFAAHIDAEGCYEVDERLWRSDWAESWVAFADLIGFANVSTRSEPTVLNLTVRFHRALTAVAGKYPDARFLRFTDAAYVASPDVVTVMKAASDLQHYCLAMNAIRLANGTPAWSHMLVPRITIAKGRLLTPPDPMPVEARFVGIDASSLMIGDSIVHAYKAERGSGGSLVSIRAEDAPEAREQVIRGNNGGPRTLLTNWTDGLQFLDHDNVVDLPWLALRCSQPAGSELWAESRAGLAEKIRTFRDQWQFMFRDFVYQQQDMVVGKHYLGAQRHLVSLLDMQEGARPRRLRTIESIETELG